MPTKSQRERFRERAQNLFETQSLMAVSTAFEKDELHTSTMLFATDAKFNICLATHTDSLKAQQLRKNPHASGVMWSLGDLYVQWRGNAHELHSRAHINAWLDKLAHKAVNVERFWPPIFQFHGQDYAVFLIKPTWLRAMDLSELVIRASEQKTETIIGRSYDKKSPARRR